VLLTHDWSAKVTDFGVSRLLHTRARIPDDLDDFTDRVPVPEIRFANTVGLDERSLNLDSVDIPPSIDTDNSNSLNVPLLPRSGSRSSNMSQSGALLHRHSNSINARHSHSNSINASVATIPKMKPKKPDRSDPRTGIRFFFPSPEHLLPPAPVIIVCILITQSSLTPKVPLSFLLRAASHSTVDGWIRLCNKL
jgi:hypothetical protein